MKAWSITDKIEAEVCSYLTVGRIYLYSKKRSEIQKSKALISYVLRNPILSHVSKTLKNDWINEIIQVTYCFDKIVLFKDAL